MAEGTTEAARTVETIHGGPAWSRARSEVPTVKKVVRPKLPREGRQKGFGGAPTPETSFENLLEEATGFLTLCHEEIGEPEDLAARLEEVAAEIDDTGTYVHTFAELEHGARVAWRNSVRCIGRQCWQVLELLDHRDLESPEEIAGALEDYLRGATNDGHIRPAIAVFRPPVPGDPGMRIWNDQLIRYAGYQGDGAVLGDPGQGEITRWLETLGWQPPEPRGPFDILPVLVEDPAKGLFFFELERDAVLEVSMEHPEHEWFAELGLRWHAVPSIANMRLEVGGISYTAAPFNGWYMGTEIGARNFGDGDRYDMLPEVAQRLGLDIQRERSLWRDRALVELNLAVLHSFETSGVKIVDHHSESRRFERFEERESGAGRETKAEWSWVVPPISGSASSLFFHHYDAAELKPNFFYQHPPWQLPEGGGCPFH